MEIKDILKPGELQELTQFSDEELDWINKRINTRKDGKAGVECVVRGKNADGDYFELKPEEIVRQLYAHSFLCKPCCSQAIGRIQKWRVARSWNTDVVLARKLELEDTQNHLLEFGRILSMAWAKAALEL